MQKMGCCKSGETKSPPPTIKIDPPNNNVPTSPTSTLSVLQVPLTPASTCSLQSSARKYSPRSAELTISEMHNRAIEENACAHNWYLGMRNPDTYELYCKCCENSIFYDDAGTIPSKQDMRHLFIFSKLDVNTSASATTSLYFSNQDDVIATPIFTYAVFRSLVPMVKNICIVLDSVVNELLYTYTTRQALTQTECKIIENACKKIVIFKLADGQTNLSMAKATISRDLREYLAKFSEFS
jgi:hypothetical protein